MKNLFRVVMVIVMLMSMVAGIAVASGEVNINSASKEELMQLEGIGGAYAEKIIQYREENGPFEKAEDIMNVKGVGTSTYEKNKERIIVSDEGESAPVSQ